MSTLSRKDLPTLRRLHPVYFRRWWRNMVGQIDHETVIEQATNDGRLSYSYAFMVFVSAGVAATHRC